ncbi:aminopeptidase P family protein [Sediminibacterium ginsengisoli]|uniref:Xaa-Pro aminopeptidase n=1 Tax=Sediminibacterium ginsengisoli TaxID=413434 RepID=A0A1T4K132_9BACT|nr:aminopeptidase P family protein [Sediminibacterium ginsengisoli]SJZ36114.1 aminopeptidase P Metallo peptidase. MEROPS family M24B [Sediminibacterium ginsengisoli]
MLRKLLPALCLTLLLAPVGLLAQQKSDYPDDYLSPEFHAGRRAAVKEKMPANSVGVFFAAQVRNRNNDVSYLYSQNKNFYYLTGLNEPNSLLLLFKTPVTILGKTGTEFLFVQPRNPQQEMWTGKILGVEGVTARYKFENVFVHNQFNFSTVDFSKYDSVLTTLYSENILSRYYGRGGMDPLSRMAQAVDSALTTYKKPIAARTTQTIFSTLRGIKQPEEIALIEKATLMSVEGHNEVIRAVKPGMTEYQAQAIMEYFFKKNGSEYPGYPSINGSGENSCVLHYETNLKLMKDGDLLLSDCAAEYHGYTADVTRTVPVNGKFTNEQRVIYELVLEAQDSGFAACKPGNSFRAPHMAAASVIARGLMKLGIISTESEARAYFPHGTSHHLGLDVHDVGPNVLSEGVVLTVEPGIYIPPNSKCDKKWWSIGVRIEDDILITKDGYRNLSAGAPRTVKEVEKMAKEKSLFP